MPLVLETSFPPSQIKTSQFHANVDPYKRNPSDSPTVGESDGFVYTGQHLCEIAKFLFVQHNDNFIEVFLKVLVGDLCSIAGGLYSVWFSVCTIIEITLAEMKRSSLYECDCLESAVNNVFSLSSRGDESRCLITARVFTICGECCRATRNNRNE